MRLRSDFLRFDARLRYELPEVDAPEPKGCRCGDVITARAEPKECKMFGRACTPVHPLGPCMVSSEGSCQVAFKYQRANPRLKRREVLL